MIFFNNINTSFYKYNSWLYCQFIIIYKNKDIYNKTELEMKKIIFIIVTGLFLNGCFQVLALVGPAATGVTTGNIYQSAISYSVSYGVQKSTGKTIVENVIDLSKKSKDKVKIVKKEKNEVLVNSFYPKLLGHWSIIANFKK